LNMWCTLCCYVMIGPSFFQEKVVYSSNYLDMTHL
jgi:hypothetical protein